LSKSSYQIYVIVFFLFASAPLLQADVTLETVAVGHVGNAPDSHGDGYGAVSYAYRIGTYEVTAGQYCQFLNAVAKTDTYGLYDPLMNSDEEGCQITQITLPGGDYAYDFSGRPSGSGSEADWSARPVNYVSWGDAARFANWLHNSQPVGLQDANTTEDGAYELNGATSEAALVSITRESDAVWAIPTEDEWYKAAYHKNNGLAADYYDYPTGSDTAPGNSNADPDSGSNATFYGSWYTTGPPYYRTDVGEHELSDSPYGTFDQGGNVYEWNEAAPGLGRGLRGGAFNYGENDLRASYRNHLKGAAGESYYIGFRVANVPEPATMAMFAVGGLAMLRRRRFAERKKERRP